MDDETVEEVPAKQERPVFEGFRKPEKPDKYFYHVPNEWTDITAEIDNLAELKVIEYIMRHTWGFKEYDQFKHITVDEFMYGRLKIDGTRMDKGTGLKSDRSVRDGLKAAIDHGYVVCDVNARDKARIRKSYKLKMRLVVSTTQDGSNHHSEDTNLPPDTAPTTRRTKKETREVNRGKEREKEGDDSYIHSSLPDFCLTKLTQVAHDCGEEVDMAEAERIYQQSGKSGDEFYDLLFGTEAIIKRYGPRTMQEFFRQLYATLEAK